MAATTTAPAMTDERAELLALIEGADSVELKLTVSMSHRSRAGAALGVDPLDGQIRQVYFFDTPDLALYKSGLVVRARRVQQKGDDSVVKLRPVVPHELAADLRSSPNFAVEVDAMPGGHVCSGSMKRSLETANVRDVALGAKPIRKLFSKEQRALYAAHAPEGLALDDLSILGPIFVLKLKFAPAPRRRKRSWPNRTSTSPARRRRRPRRRWSSSRSGCRPKPPSATEPSQITAQDNHPDGMRRPRLLLEIVVRNS